MSDIEWGAPDPASRINDNAIRTSSRAVVSLTLSLSGLFLGLPAILGTILGFSALSRIKKTGERGRKLAIWAVVVGIVATLLWTSLVALILTLQANRYADLNEELCTNLDRDTFLEAREQDPLFCRGYATPTPTPRPTPTRKSLDELRSALYRNYNNESAVSLRVACESFRSKPKRFVDQEMSLYSQYGAYPGDPKVRNIVREFWEDGKCD